MNPATGAPIASVIQADEAAYEEVMKTAASSFVEWRMVPAPARGEVVRDLGNELRKFKDPWAAWFPRDGQDPLRGPR